jgi:hypothetical protein
MPGLIPFTTVEYEEPLADKLFDRALLHGWLSCIGAGAGARAREWSEREGNQAATRACVRESVCDGRRRVGGVGKLNPKSCWYGCASVADRLYKAKTGESVGAPWMRPVL